MVACSSDDAAEPSIRHSSWARRSALGQPLTAEKPGSPLLLGIFQYQLAPSNNGNEAFAQAPEWHLGQHPVASEALQTLEF